MPHRNLVLLEQTSDLAEYVGGGDAGVPAVLGGTRTTLADVTSVLRGAGRFGLVSFAALGGLGGTGPYLRPPDIVVIGLPRDDEHAVTAATAGLTLIDAPTVAYDPGFAAENALQLMKNEALDGFWVHVDAAVVDTSGGVSAEDLRVMLHPLLASPRLAGVDVFLGRPADGHASAHPLSTLVIAEFSATRQRMP